MVLQVLVNCKAGHFGFPNNSLSICIIQNVEHIHQQTKQTKWTNLWKFKAAGTANKSANFTNLAIKQIKRAGKRNIYVRKSTEQLN